MNYKNYLSKKENGMAEITTAGGGYAFVVKQFSAETGELLPPEIEALDRDKLLEEKVELANSIADIENILADIDALNAKQSDEPI